MRNASATTIDARVHAPAPSRSTTSTLVEHIVASSDIDDIALIDPHANDQSSVLHYGDLIDAVDRRRSELGLAERSLVVLTGQNCVDWVVTYLALVADGHVPLLVPSHLERVVDRWDPAAIVSVDRLGWAVEYGPTRTRPELHSDLAVLMGTSGSTGSPKLVRLSTTNLVANATAIAEFQRLTPSDRAITNLPLHYSMGLSVLHSHLVSGASTVVTDTSVVDACFAQALADHHVTNIAGVPHTFDLLDQTGPERIHVPSLRFLAQAGGRMHPERVAAWAARADSWGAEWFTMYGQTEATARMSYVPAHLVRDHPGAIGCPIPGGTLTIEPLADDEPAEGANTLSRTSVSPRVVDPGEVGEIVYRGPNVMLGYAIEPHDLALGAELDALRTGDLGRIDPTTGLLEVVGRCARRIKPFGLRVDLDDVERRLATSGREVRVAGDDTLVVAVRDDGESDESLVALLAEVTGLPRSHVAVCPGPPPRHANGKVDDAAILAAGRSVRASGDTFAAGAGGPIDELVAVASEVLGLDAVSADQSFVDLGGDSLSYVECSIRFEQIVGRLPNDWHLRPLRRLATPDRPRRLARVDTTVLLRSVGILAVVSTHMRLWHVPGGAHLMLGVVGYNIARFLLPIDDTRARIRAGLRTVARVAVPTVLWTAGFMLVAQYTWTTLTLANNYIGPRSHAGNHWHFWFIEVFVHLVVITTLISAIPIVRRLDRRWPYAFPLALLAATLTLRMEWADMGDWYNLRFRTHAVAWFFVLGWLVQRSSTWQQKLLTTVLCLVTAPGVFQNPQREYFIALGLVLLVWASDLPVPRLAVRPLATLAAASMWIFISHFMIWPPMKDAFIVEVAYPLTIIASLGVWWAATRLPRRIGEAIGDRRARASRPLLTSTPSVA